jgi:hypothetical protein
MVAIIENNVAAGKKLLQYYLSGVENPSPPYIATAVLAVLDEMKPTAPEAFSGMVSYLRDVDAKLEKNIVDLALEIALKSIESEITEQQKPSLEQQFTAELAKRSLNSH